MKYILPLIVSLILVAACEEEGPLPEPRMVLEGGIDSDGYPEVFLTMSVVPGGTPSDISEALVRWASVSVTEETEGRTVMLTGAPSRDHFPPYRYYSYEMKGRPGHIYTVAARYKGQEITSTSPMPEATPIGGVRQEPVPSDPSLRALTLYFTAPRDCPAYYHVAVRVRGDGARFLPGTLGTAEALEPGAEVTVPVLRGKTSTDTLDLPAQMPVGAVVDVRLERVTEPVWRFWRAFNNAALVGSSQFISSSQSMPSNITGGYGVWAARGTSAITVKVE